MVDTSEGDGWETRGTTVTYDGFCFNVVEDDVVLPDGSPLDFEFINEPDAVVVLAFTPSEDVVVLNEWRQTVQREVEYGLPGGSIHPDETPREAARRELREETGYVPDSVERTLVAETTNGLTDGHYHLFTAYGCEKEHEPNLDYAEPVSVNCCSFAEVAAAVRTNEARDSKTLLAVFNHLLQQREDS